MLKVPRRTYPVYINNRNWLTPVIGMVEYLRQLPVEIFIVDNNSSYEPLLNWYNESDVNVIRLASNHGWTAPWSQNLILTPHEQIKRYGHPYYISSDSDLELSAIPLDVINVLLEGLKKYPWATKSGLSLEINDIPKDHMDYDITIEWESGFWHNRLDDKFYNSAVGHTFALYNVYTDTNVGCQCHPAIRSDRPYTAKHLPWYITKDNITEEAIYYIENAGELTQLRNPFKPRSVSPWVIETLERNRKLRNSSN